jgi:hypothetical protein
MGLKVCTTWYSLTFEVLPRSTTPALEGPICFTLVVHYSAEIDPIGAFRSEASAITLGGVNGSKVWYILTFEVLAGSTTPALESPNYFTVVIHRCPAAVLFSTFRNATTAIEFSTLLSRKVSTKTRAITVDFRFTLSPFLKTAFHREIYI